MLNYDSCIALCPVLDHCMQQSLVKAAVSLVCASRSLRRGRKKTRRSSKQEWEDRLRGVGGSPGGADGQRTTADFNS